MTKSDRHKKTALSYGQWLKAQKEDTSIERKVEMFNTIADTEYDISRPIKFKPTVIKKVKI
jgi:hypothetical protein